MEQPQYVLRPKILRFLIPKVIQLTILSIIFYLAVSLNLSLLEIELGKIYNIVITCIICLFAAADALITYSKNSKPYVFFQNRVIVHGKQIYYSETQRADMKRNVLDKLFNTCSISMFPKGSISYVQNSYQIYSYVHNLVQYANENLYIEQKRNY